MKTVKEVKKINKIKPKYTIKLTEDMTADDLHNEFIDAKIKKKLPLNIADIEFTRDFFYRQGVEDGLEVKRTLRSFSDAIGAFVDTVNHIEKPKKVKWYKKLWHFITFRGWK
jgi:hypothetical protein